MHAQHLSDEAIAAFADDVLSGSARQRAVKHTAVCAECNHAVAVQREAVWALRAAPAPSLPTGLVDRLRGLPATTPLTTLPTAIAPDGSAMLSVMGPVDSPVVPHAAGRGFGSGLGAALGAGAMAAFVPEPTTRQSHRLRSVVGAAAALTVVGALAAGSGGQTISGTPSRHTPPAGVVPVDSRTGGPSGADTPGAPAPGAVVFVNTTVHPGRP